MANKITFVVFLFYQILNFISYSPVVASNQKANPQEATQAPLVSDSDLKQLAQHIWSNDFNSLNANEYNLSTQGRITQRNNKADHASSHLFSGISAEVFTRPTYAKFINLLDNYHARVGVRETVNGAEVHSFIDEIMKSHVMRAVWQFLAERGLADNSEMGFKEQIYEWWFSLYSRSRGVADSSGFEHVFVGEVKKGQITGLHNWVQFALEERRGNLDYKGYYIYREPNQLKLQFTWFNKWKQTSTMFVGTSPEFEMALLTLCFRARANEKCRFTIDNRRVTIITHTLRQGRGLLHVGSAYALA